MANETVNLFSEAPSEVSIYEVSPRDGLQNERLTVALPDKVRLLSLIHISEPTRPY